MLAQPVKRSAFALAQFGALAAATLIVTVVLFASVVGGSAAVGLEISTGNVVAACVSTMLLSLLFGTLALAAGGAASGKGRAIAFAAALALFSWIIDGLAATVRWLEPFQAISPYHLAFGDGPLANGAPWADWAWLALMIAATLGVSVAGLRRRDIG